MANYLTSLTQILFVLLVVGIIAMLIFGLKKVFQKMSTNREQSNQLLHYILLGILFWLATLGVLAHIGFFQNWDALPPRITVAVIPPVILIILLLSSKNFTKILLHTPLSWLVYAQVFRIGMELILWMGYKAGFVPFQMTFEGWNYDIIVGITAISAGMVFFRKKRIRRYQAIIWNVFGLLLLINIVAISVLSTPSPLRFFPNEPTNTMIAYVPFVWLPGFVVPFALAMHLFSLKQLFLLNNFDKPVGGQQSAR